MKKLYDKYFICEDGHVTVGEKKTKCDAEEWQINYIKGKRKGKWETDKKLIGKCGKPIVKEDTLPNVIDFTTVWSHEVMHAFLIDQKIDAEFMISLQMIYSKLWKEIQDLKEMVHAKK